MKPIALVIIGAAAVLFLFSDKQKQNIQMAHLLAKKIPVKQSAITSYQEAGVQAGIFLIQMHW